jgi:transcription-repair coupling factor (superfamily II helicase)
VVAPSPRRAIEVEVDLELLLGEGESFLFPQREARPYESSEPHLEIGALRVEAVEALLGGRTRLLVTTLRALQERAPIPAELAGLRISLRVGEEVGFQKLIADLEERGFERVPLVEEVGQFAVRGGLLDIYSFGTPEPVRVEFWGDEIASLRFFDVLDQRTNRTITEAHILPVDFQGDPQASTLVSRSLLELLPADALLLPVLEEGGAEWRAELDRTWDYVRRLHDELVADGQSPDPPDTLFLPAADADEMLAGLARVDLDTATGPDTAAGQHLPAEPDISLSCSPPPPILRDMSRLRASLRSASASGGRTLVLCDNQGQCDRLEEILGGPKKIPPGAHVVVGSLAAGFVLEAADPPLQVLTDHEIFRRSRRVRSRRRFRGAVALESLAQLSPGDPVVHMDHGVGVFRGLQHVEIGGEELESMAIEYAGGEILRVPVYRLDLVERWVGESENAAPPAVHRIGGKRWKTLKRKTSEAIEMMTVELLQLYAKRESAAGFAFSPDTVWQKEMESSFLYEDTPDQRTATQAVKRDMESNRPMDRLICGDVGYGKTEIAIRAAFKAVQDGKQVAVLAPTTVLVEQHRHTFAERLADYPVRIGALSRFRTPASQKKILTGLAGGGVDIVVGTHRLLSSDVEFADLGLLIVDEEQRFGVRHKERLKQMRASVDVLTLTATPIPRTLHLSLMGLRDLSLIRTPPRDRMPIITHVVPWSDHILGEALLRELDRGGQAFFLHNLVSTIHGAAERIRALVPEARIDIAHGQMRPRELDRVMRDFVDGGIDVLVCSSIIENGLDVPNANTLIVNSAEHFGLSQLYQIRGRVGRSDRRAFCYLVASAELSDEAERRLRVLEHHTELGSGYSVALRDMELRGAGNLLGGEQSGFAHSIGIDAYMRLLAETVKRLRGDDEGREFADPDVSIAGSAYLPDAYISDAGQKLHLYQRLSKLTRMAEVTSLREELADRFGTPPTHVEHLLDGAALRILGRRIGVERILVRPGEARVNFRSTVVPRLSALERPLKESSVDVEVRRMTPLSLVLHQAGPDSLVSTLILALTTLIEARDEAA